MTQESILLPVFALGGFTFFISLWMAKLRFKAVKQGDLNRRYYELNRGYEPPDYLVKVSRNFENLLEIPVLFYVVALMIYITKQTDFIYLSLAWLYVGSRFIHSYIHTTYNNVRHRMIPFLLGGMILIVIWLRLFVAII
ncbi:MAPEG family protein [Methylomonas paludis]|uniref:MAPEG family protein n=1 Tax=Methylomonas paludis TaxID=1173101 RepID=A0A975MPD8_9GAMM|nr:MAPEG family protein [Methylomonas paludis]QWF71578.1 MAPEG family protein [Methylomonas paludis]